MITIGDSVKFGSYFQSDYYNKSSIEWTVMDLKNGQALLLSKYILDVGKFDDYYIDWETSSLRRWLNDQFYNLAFSKEEKLQIVKTKLSSKIDSDTNVYTDDYVFIFNTDDIIDCSFTHFFSEKMRKELAKKPTRYALSKNPYLENGNGLWWLRDGCEIVGDNYVKYVDSGGKDYHYEEGPYGNIAVNNLCFCDAVDGSIVPAIWVKANAFLNKL